MAEVEDKDPLGLRKALNNTTTETPAQDDPLGLRKALKKKAPEPSGSDVKSISPILSDGGVGGQPSLQSLNEADFANKATAVPFKAQADKDAEIQRQEQRFVADNTPGKIGLTDPTVKPNILSRQTNAFEAATKNYYVPKPKAGAVKVAEEKEGSWSNTVPYVTHALTKMITEPLSGVAKIVRDHLSDNKDAALYGKDGELSTWGQTVDNGSALVDPLGKLIIGLDAYNNAANQADAENALPNNFAGNTASGLIGIAPDIIITTLFPEEKLATSATKIGHLKAAVWNPFTKLLAAKGALAGYSEAEQRGATADDAAIEGGIGLAQGAKEGVEMGLLGGAAGMLSSKGFKLMNRLGIVKNGKLTKAGLDAVSDATVFGLAPVAHSLIDGKEISRKEIETGVGTGLAFGLMKAKNTFKEYGKADSDIKEIMQDRSASAILSFVNATPEAIRDAYELPDAAGDINARAIEHAFEAKKEQDIDKKNQLIAVSSTLAKASDVKATVEAYRLDREGFKESINSSELGDEQKAKILDKLNQVDQIIPADIKSEEINNAEPVSPEFVAPVTLTAEMTAPETQERVAELNNRVNEIQSTPEASNITANPSAVEALIETVGERADIQLDLLNKAKESIPNEEMVTIRFNSKEEVPVELRKYAYEKEGVIMATLPQVEADAAVERLSNNTQNEPINTQENISAVEAPEILEPQPAPGSIEPAPAIEDSFVGDINANEQVLQPGGSTPDASIGGNVKEGGFAYRSGELGDINISSNDSGTYDVTYSDGVTVPMSAEDLRDLHGFDVAKIDAPEQDARLYGTDDPREIANLYDERVRELEEGSPEGAIAAYGPRTSAEEFARVNDANNVNQLMRLNYFKGGNDVREIGLDVQAQEINDQAFNGAEVVTPEMIADFMVSYPKGEATFKTGTGDKRLAEINDRHRELTGRDLTRQDARKIADELTRESVSTEVDDDVPFQRGEGTTISPEQVQAAQRVLERAFPNIDTEFHETVEDFMSSASKNGIETSTENAPNAFVGKDGTVHFNPEKINADTQVHEYGHVLTRWAKTNAPKIWERIQDLGSEQTDIHDELKANGYKLRGSRLAEEAFVTMLGREGAGAGDAALRSIEGKNVVRRTINEMWTKFQRYLLEKTGFDISKFRNIKDMGIADFMETLNDKYLNSGVEISRISSEDIAGDISEQKARPIRQPGEAVSAYAQRLLEWTKDYKATEGDLPLRNLKTNLKPVREKLREIRMSYREGYKNAQADTKTAFLEYDRFQKQLAKEAATRERDSTKEKFGEYDRDIRNKQKQKLAELRERYENKMAAEKLARQKQLQATKDLYKGIRSEIKDILSGLNKTGALGKVKFTDKELLSFSNQLNNVKTEKGLDKFRDFVNRVVQHVDVLRDVQDSRELLKDVKKLIKADYVTQNIKTLIRDLATLNPYTVQDTKQFKAILEDLSKGQRSKEFSTKTEQEIYDFISKEKDADLQGRIADAVDTLTDISNSQAHQAGASQAATNLPLEYELRRMLGDVYNDPDLTFNEKVKKVNIISDALEVYDRQVNDAFDRTTGQVNGQPEDFNKILNDLENPEADVKEKHRDVLEDVARSRQDLIDADEPTLSAEQKESLAILKKTSLVGQDANTLRLFNNILDNVTLNNDHSGVGIFEAKAIGNGKEGALKVVDYLKTLSTSLRSAEFNAAGKLRSIAASQSVILSRIANNDFKFLSKLTTGTYLDEIKKGFTATRSIYDKAVDRKLEEVFKQYPDVARNGESVVRLSLYSFINQSREFSSSQQQSAELRRRIDIINKDIAIKTSEGLKADKNEGALASEVWDGIAEKVLDKTGLDIRIPEEAAQIEAKDVAGIKFLNDGETAAYKVFRDANDGFRDEHEAVVKRQINQDYETWNNHMRDGYRHLGGGLVDVVSGDAVAFATGTPKVDSQSVASTQRVKGDPLATKSGEKQRVLNLNFFDVQEQGLKDMLFDIHTLKSRMIFDEAIKNRELRDALGPESHEIYKNNVQNYVMNELGLGKGLGQKEIALLKKGLNVVNKIAVTRQLLSTMAVLKQGISAIGNTVGNTGFDFDTMYKSARVMNSPSVQELLSKHPINERADNLASLNTIGQKGLGDADNIVSQQQGGKAAQRAAKGFQKYLNKLFLDMSNDGTIKKSILAKPIEFGDVAPAKWSWVTYYAKDLIKRGVVSDFESIDWDLQNQGPDREAASYAESMTARQLNENQKNSRSDLVNSNEIGYTVAKMMLLPFGGFGLHKGQVLFENIRTLTNKSRMVDKNFRKNEGNAAALSILGSAVESILYAGTVTAVGFGTAYLKKGLTVALTSLLGNDDEQKEYVGKNDIAIEKLKETWVHRMVSKAASDFLFSSVGNAPQKEMEAFVNKLTKTNMFYQTPISLNQEIRQGNGTMFSAAINGYPEIGKGLYRSFIDNTNKNGVPVDMTPYQRSVYVIDALSAFANTAGVNDPDLARAIAGIRRQVDFSLAKPFKEENLVDLSQAGPLKIGNKQVQLTQEHQDFYEQEKAKAAKALEAKGASGKRATSRAAAIAKSKLLDKFGYKKILGEGAEIKKKK